MIEKRRLGKNGPDITTVGFGAWAAGGPWLFGWGKQDDAESVTAIRRSVELGVNWVDTAAVYGWGHSEEVTGRAIAPLPRDEVLVFTKCGRVRGDGEAPRSDLRPASVKQQLEDSLRRLATDYVDLFQFHWPDNETGTPVEDSWAAMAEPQDEGKARWIGVSNFDVPLLERISAVRHVDSVQPPFSLLRQDVAADVLPWCLRNGTGVIVYSPMQAGLLSGTFDLARVQQDDWRRRSPYYQEPQLGKNLAFVEALRPIAARHGATVGNVAVAWTLANPAVTGAIVGARRPGQVDENVGAMGLTLTAQDLADIAAALSSTM